MLRDASDFDRNMLQLLHSLEDLIPAEDKKRVIRNAARLEEKLTADAFMGVSTGGAAAAKGQGLGGGYNNHTNPPLLANGRGQGKSGYGPGKGHMPFSPPLIVVKQFQGHNVALDASSLMWSGDQVGVTPVLCLSYTCIKPVLSMSYTCVKPVLHVVIPSYLLLCLHFLILCLLHAL